MAKWILICTNCEAEFQHSQISDIGMSRLFLPEKPIIPTGQKCVCPNCGFGGLYQRTDLRYRVV
jgi:DNA-directed RNA polymerase subunit RPC12/RpoP